MVKQTHRAKVVKKKKGLRTCICAVEQWAKGRIPASEACDFLYKIVDM